MLLMPERLRLSPGDVFTVPLDDEDKQVGYGQFVAKYKLSDMAVACFDTVSPTDELMEPEDVVRSPVVLFGFTTDALLYHGVWRVIGRAPAVIDAIALPFFKVKRGGRWTIISVDGTKSWAVEDEPGGYDYRWNQAPIAFQLALRALKGAGTWDPMFDMLVPEYSAARSKPPD
jgi:hypothetical protein